MVRRSARVAPSQTRTQLPTCLSVGDTWGGSRSSTGAFLSLSLSRLRPPRVSFCADKACFDSAASTAASCFGVSRLVHPCCRSAPPTLSFCSSTCIPSVAGALRYWPALQMQFKHLQVDCNNTVVGQQHALIRVFYCVVWVHSFSSIVCHLPPLRRYCCT